MNDNNSDITEIRLATDKVGSLVARYSIPAAVAFVFFTIQSLIDGIIVGNYLGADALASVTLILPAYTIPLSIALMLGIGTQAQMSIAMGEKNYSKAKTALVTGAVAALVYALVIRLLFTLFPEQLARLMGSGGDLLEGSLDYIRGLMPFIAVNLCYTFLDYMLKTLGRPRTSMTLVVSALLLNIVLSILFVTQFDLGTYGVGLATGISITVACVLALIVVLRQLRISSGIRAGKGKFSWRMLGRMLYNGSSEGVTEIAMGGVTVMLFNMTFMRYAGKDGVAAFAVTNYIIFIGTSILLGISDGAIPIVSYNYGAGLWHRVRQAFRVVVKTNFIFGCVFLALLWIFGDYAISIFLDDSSQAVIDMATKGSRIMVFAFLLNGFNIFSASFFTALDNAKWSLIISMSRGLVFIVIGITLLPMMLGTNGIWMTVPVAELLTVVIAAVLLRRLFKKHIGNKS